MSRAWIGHAVGRVKGLPWVGIVISVVCLALIVLRNLYPSVFQMDAISIGLLIVAVAPWIRSAIKSIEVAGVGKIELNDVEKAAKKVEESNLPGPDDAGVEFSAEASVLELPTATAPHEGNEPATVGSPSASQHAVTPIADAYTVHPFSSQWEATKQVIGSSKGLRPLVELAALESSTAVLSSDARTQVQLVSLREMLLNCLRYLCQLRGIPSMGLPTTGMIDRLKAKSVLTRSQGDGVLAAVEMVNEVVHTPATAEAAQRTLDVAKDVVRSLDYIIRKTEIERLIADRVGFGTSRMDDSYK